MVLPVDADREKLPSRSVMAAFLVPFSVMEAPMMGSLSAPDTTVPEILMSWAFVMIQTNVSMKLTKTRFRFFIRNIVK